MAKRVLMAILGVYILWQVLDFSIHAVILSSSYAATQELWRSEDEMKMGLMAVVTLISAAIFVLLYVRLAAEKKMSAALTYGLLLGLAFGISMGYGSYAVMPIPYFMAFVWFAGTLVEMTLAGLLTGLIVRD